MGMMVRTLLRRRLGSVVVLAMVSAVLFGGSLAALAGARRSSTAVDRFLAYSRPEDVFVEPAEDVPLDMAAVDRLPQVVAAGYQSYLPMAPVDDSGRVDPSAAGSISPYLRTPLLGPADAMLRPRVLRGRDLDPTAPLEALVDEELARARDLVPGSHLRMATFSQAQMATLFAEPEIPAPLGPVVDLQVTGVVRTPADLAPRDQDFLTSGSSLDLYLSPAFYPAWGPGVAVFGPPVSGSGQGLLLRHGAHDVAAFERGLRSLPGGAEATLAVGASDSLDAVRGARRAISVETTALVALGMALAIAGGVLIAQGLARLARGTTSELTSLRAVGGRPIELVFAAAAGGACAVGLATLGAAVVAVVGSRFTPIGLGRVAEVSPGVRLDGLVVGLGCLLVLVLGLAAALLAAMPTVRSIATGAADRPVRSSQLAAWVASFGAPLAPTLGAAFAVEPPGQRRAPLRYATSVGVLALVVVAGAASYTRSLDHLVDDRAEQGAAWDLVIGNQNTSDFTSDDLARLLGDPSVAGASAAASREVRASVDGRDVAIVGIDELRGGVGPRVTSGRMPTGPREVALGRLTASHLQAGVGDQVRVRMNGATQPMTVVGIAVLNPGLAFSMGIGEGAVVTIDQLRELFPGAPVNTLLVRLVPGASVSEVIISLGAEFTNVSRPASALEVVNLRRVRSLPIALAVAIAGAAITLLAFALLTSARERRREITVLRAFGATRRQIGAAMTWQGLWLYGGALVGLPLGVAAGRIVWDQVVHRIGLLTPTHVPYAVLARVSAVGLALVLLIGALQAVVVCRRSAALGLRAE